jgi:hypothetical protein
MRTEEETRQARLRALRRIKGLGAKAKDCG